MTQTDSSQAKPDERRKLSRREMLGAAGAVLAGGGIALGLRQRSRHEHGRRADVVIAAASNYHADLTGLILDGLRTLGFDRNAIRGKRVLLKPNLVDTALRASHVNTNPAVILAAVEAFRRLDAGHVLVGEGQGHRRDSQLLLDESGLGRVLDEVAVPFIDLNHDDVEPVPNTGGATKLDTLFLPRTVLEADFLVSLPKLKTHHWAGVTCAMKNLFGVMPGLVYGWPKNVLHFHGIPKAIVDINAVAKPSFAIVDGIECMEGDGPLMGTPKHVGCLIMGANLPAVDATAVRIMGLNPYGVPYLTAVSGRQGPIHEWNITQRGERIETLRTRFDVVTPPDITRLELV